MAAFATEEQVAIRLLVDDKKNRVVLAQAGKDFVDVLLSFLTLPLGTIARLVDKETNMKKVSIGSLSSLYESVGNVEEKLFWTATCKEMLLHPRNSMESCCQNLKLNIDDTEKTMYFICENIECSRKSNGLLSIFKNQICKCGKLMNRVIYHGSSLSDGRSHDKGFVPEMATFIISDDLAVKPENFKTSVCLPMSLGYEDFDVIRQVTLNVTKKEILDLLKCSLFSKTPLTDTFLKKDQIIGDSQVRSVLDSDIGELETNDGGQMMEVKVIIRKSNRKVLLALADADFVDFLLSFLTFPLGGVEHMLNGNTCLGSIDNLYKSIVDLDGSMYLSSPDLKDNLVKSQLAHQFKLHNQILPIDEVLTFDYCCYSKEDSEGNVISAYLVYRKNYFTVSGETGVVYAPLSYLEPQSSKGETYWKKGGRGFAKRPSLYMVTDDLVVTPSSSFSAVSFLTESRIPPSDLEERVINIGKKEGLSLLKASLISSSALTNGLSQFIKPI